MPAKSAKQQRFMAAVANNPEFAKKVGVPKRIGDEFMMKKGYVGGGKLEMVEKDGKMVPFYAADGKGKMMAGGKVKKYAEGAMVDMSDIPTIKAPEGPTRRRPTPKEREEGFKGMDLPPSERPKKKKKKKMMGGGMAKKGYKSGGKVRGCGMASKGVRPAKMVVMKGS